MGKNYSNVLDLLTITRDDYAKHATFCHPQSRAASFAIGETAMDCVMDAAHEVTGKNYREVDEGDGQNELGRWFDDDDREDNAECLTVLDRAIALAIERTCKVCDVIGGGLHKKGCAALAAMVAKMNARWDAAKQKGAA